MGLDLNPRSAILFVIFLQAIATSALLFRRAKNNNQQSDIYLAALVFFLGLSLTDYIIGFLRIFDQYPRIIFFPFENLFLVSALIYLFILSLLQKEKPNLKTLIQHLSLPVLYFIFHFIIFLLDKEDKQNFSQKIYFPFVIYIEVLGYYILSSYYFVSIIKLLHQYNRIAHHSYSQISLNTINWLRYFVFGFIAYLIIDFIFSATEAIFKLDFSQQYWKYLIRGVLTSFLCIAGYNFEDKIAISNTDFEADKINEDETKNELISESELVHKKQIILDYFEKAKPYLNPELDLNTLSKNLDLNSNVVSYIINKGFEKNFNDFVNLYRVNDLKEKLKDPANRHLTLLALAFDAGFNSKTTFNRVFKKLINQSPSDYWQHMKKTT